MIIKKKLRSDSIFKILNLIIYNYKHNLNSERIINKFIYWIDKSITKEEIKYLINNHPICQNFEIISINFNKSLINKSLIKSNKNYSFKYKKLILLLKLNNNYN